MDTPQIIGIAIGLGVVALLLLIIFIKANIVLCQPNELVVISGRRRKLADGSMIGYRVLRGGRGFKRPLVETVGRLPLNSIPLELRIDNVMTEGMIPVSIDAKATVKLAGNEADGMDAAIELVKPGTTTDEIAKVWPKAEEFGFEDEMDAFGLQFGHGVGVGLHERPVISRLNSLDNPVEIKEGMLFALETYAPAADGRSAARIEEELIVDEETPIDLVPPESAPLPPAPPGPSTDSTVVKVPMQPPRPPTTTRAWCRCCSASVWGSPSSRSRGTSPPSTARAGASPA